MGRKSKLSSSRLTIIIRRAAALEKKCRKKHDALSKSMSAFYFHVQFPDLFARFCLCIFIEASRDTRVVVEWEKTLAFMSIELSTSFQWRKPKYETETTFWHKFKNWLSCELVWWNTVTVCLSRASFFPSARKTLYLNLGQTQLLLLYYVLKTPFISCVIFYSFVAVMKCF